MISVLEKIERHALTLKDGECWLTDYKPNAHGYKPLRLDNGTLSSLHRIAYEAHYAEPIPEGLHILHSCDNPLCFNPQHLSVGTNEDNIADKVSKGRQRGISSERAFERSTTFSRNNLGQFQ